MLQILLYKLLHPIFSQVKQLSSHSKAQVILINDKAELSNYIKNNIYGKKILIAMGAGSISNWIRDISEKL